MLTGSSALDAERAFARAARARRRASLLCRLRRGSCCPLTVLDERAARRAPRGGRRGVREIPVAAITATLEPSRASEFDGGFRPARRTRCRWQRVWLAEHAGIPLPPISVVSVGGGYAVRDGHHRVSVAAARGAATIDALVDEA